VVRSSQPTSVSHLLQALLQNGDQESEAAYNRGCQAAPAELLDDAAITQIKRMLQQGQMDARGAVVVLNQAMDGSPARTAQLKSRCPCAQGCLCWACMHAVKSAELACYSAGSVDRTTLINRPNQPPPI